MSRLNLMMYNPKRIPTISAKMLKVTKENKTFKIMGIRNDYENLKYYLNATEIGLLHTTNSKVISGTSKLTINTVGFFKIRFPIDHEEYSYTIKVSNVDEIRAFRWYIQYKDKNNKTYYSYSNTIIGSINSLAS